MRHLLAAALLLTTAGCHSDGAPGGKAAGQCATPEQTATYRSCKAASSEAACRDQGGEWREVPLLSHGTEFICSCPLPDEGCPCKTSTDCVSQCIAPNDRCESNEGATCQQWTRGGCRCILDSKGKAEHICAD